MNSKALLVAQHLKKLYSKDGSKPIEVIRDLNLEIYPGDQIAILGKSGAGKSTLLHILGTLEAPTSGTVHFLGQNIFNFPEAELSAFRNKQIGFIFQFHYLMLEFTALENVMMPALLGGTPRREARDMAHELLNKVGLSQRATHKPNQLSGGEQQRVAIARALITSPKLLLTDEMTGNLDPATGEQIFELIQTIHSEYKMALVSVTHDVGLAACYTRICQLVDGRLTESGKSQDPYPPPLPH